ncbi:hypothetical protein OIU84_029428 [Salix udensis]|uniref:Pectin lyase-like superfamily protein n=1 Tax=Salix udensis TaxID=889485 RepID=A0AAD6KBN0_9ROSI|nr:hypothetical protein OIU84_029428 [Salix udensis]
MDFDEKQSFGFGGNAMIARVSRFSWSPFLFLITLTALLSFQITTKTIYPIKIVFSSTSKTDVSADTRTSCVGFFGELPERKAVMSITEFGGVGDGKTSNTETFRKAIRYLKRFGESGGAQLNVPKGRWVTGSFNLTSNFTLFLEEGAVILGSQDPKEWPIIEPLPSYGRGRERLGGRHISLVHGDGLTNVVITGNNGTIDGQGKMWWELWWNRTLEHTRGHLFTAAMLLLKT